jgi:hypothetical protein
MKNRDFSMIIPARYLTALCLCAGLAWSGIAVGAPPQKPVPVPEFALVGQNIGIVQDTGTLDPAAPPTDTNDGTAFGTIAVGTSRVRSYEIRNYGTADLLLSSTLIISGPQAGDFSIVSQPLSGIAPGQAIPFSVEYHPTVAGSSVARITIVNNDPDEGSYEFAVSGSASDEGVSGLDLTSDLVFYKQYNAKGIPLLLCKMTGRVDVTNLSHDVDCSSCLVRVWVVNDDIIAPDYSNAFLVDDVIVKNVKAIKTNKKGKTKVTTKRIRFRGQVPPHYKFIFAEVFPLDPQSDTDFSNNRAKYLYGL